MVSRSRRAFAALVVLGALAYACSGGGGDNDAAPRISAIPQQSTAGGTFTLDLADYVVDREGGTMTFDVLSGGGSFAGSVYTNTFDTMGTYTVVFSATDPAGGQSTGTFDVRVTSGSFAVVREGTSGLLLVDAATEAVVRVAGATATPSFAAGLDDGRLVYQLAAGTGRQLWVFDPMTRQSTRVAAAADGDVDHLAHTSDGLVVYSTSGSAGVELFLYTPATGLSRSLAQAASGTVAAMVDADDLVYFEITSGGQADVFFHDPVENDTFAVATGATDERLQAVLAGGGVVFSRVGTGGETDLLRFVRDVGTVEVGLNVTNGDAMHKVFRASGADGQVVYTGTFGGTTELFFWDPANGQATSLASSTAGFPTVMVAAGNQVVWTIDNGSGDVDAAFHDMDDGTAAVLRNAADTTTLFAVTDGGAVQYAMLQGSSATSSLLAVSLEGTPTTVTHAGGGAMEFELLLPNGDVTGRRTDGTSIAVFDASAGTWSSFAGTGLDVVGAGVDAGDFVFAQTAAAQVDLAMWDASLGSAVTVSNVTGDDTFQASTEGKVLFTRPDTFGNDNLFAFDSSDASTAQLTETDGTGLGFDHVVLGTFTGSR